MSAETGRAEAGQKFVTFLVGAGMIFFAGWGITYIPVLRDFVPSVMVAPTPTVTLDTLDFTARDIQKGTMPHGFVQHACNKIPFLLRPLASRPHAARVIFTADGHRIGEATFSCRNGDLLDSREF